MSIIRIYIICFVLGLCSFSLAQQINANLVVINPYGKVFTLYVNDEIVNKEPQAIVKAFNVHEGWLKLRVEIEGVAGKITDSIHLKSIEKYNNKEITLSLKERITEGKNNYKFEFISIGELSGPATPIVPDLPVNLSVLDENKKFGNIYEMHLRKPIYIKNYDSASAKCLVDLDDKDIEYHLFLLKNTNDYSERIKYTRRAILFNCYTAERLVKLLNTFDTEIEKLKYAKLAFPHLTDKSNAKTIENAFLFKSVSEEYEIFLKNIAAENYQKSLNCKQAVADNEYNEIYVSVVKGKYDHDKIAIAKKAVQKHCFSSAQVKKLMDIFTHDREKLDLAKAAYNSIVDKENYKMAAESFMFGENRKDFLNFISN
ncbi:MAG: DUF4476 domain-containing protein [Bacteroidetes bacterium]|nr:DUF4476 domain-containing protein [Bacteroidota bacterium]